MKKSLYAIPLMLAFLGFSIPTRADTSVAWTSPANNSVLPVGTSVTPTGVASSVGVVGTGLDLALVLDESGSMSTIDSGAGGQTRMYYVKQAAIAMVNSLPELSTSVAIIAFDDVTRTLRQLTPLLPAANKADLLAAINSLAPGGSTAIGNAIQLATTELTSARHTAGRAQMQVVVSDGENNVGINPVTAAGQAWSAGVTVHTVGLLLTGSGATTMQDTATAGHGVYTGVNDLSQLQDIFNGTGGNLVGLDHVEVTMPDGTKQTVPNDGLGNFSAPSAWSMQPGAQTWTATAYGKDGSSASAQLTLIGGNSTTVPDGGSTIAMLALALAGLLGVARKTTR